MTAADPGRVAVGRLLRGAAEEVQALRLVVGTLERLVGDLALRQADNARAVATDLQAFDLLSQRLEGLAACLAVVAGAPDLGPDLPTQPLARVLPLAAQRAALLGAEPTPATRAPGTGPELF